MMMKYIVRVEPPLMFNINRNRVHDVREGITQLADENGGSGAKLKAKTIVRRKIRTTKNSQEEKCVHQETVERITLKLIPSSYIKPSVNFTV